MKKIFIGVLMTAALMFGLSSCSCNQEEVVTSLVEWNASARAEGEGHVKVSYPSGALEVNGNGVCSVYSSSDSLLLKATPAETVFGAPADFDEETVEFVTAAQADLEKVTVDVLEGTWSVDLELYALQPQSGLVFVFTRHWPEEPEE